MAAHEQNFENFVKNYLVNMVELIILMLYTIKNKKKRKSFYSYNTNHKSIPKKKVDLQDSCHDILPSEINHIPTRFLFVFFFTLIVSRKIQIKYV